MLAVHGFTPFALGGAFLALQYALCCWLEATSGTKPVGLFLLLLFGQWVIYAIALGTLRSREKATSHCSSTPLRPEGDLQRRSALCTILTVAVLARLLGLAAGLDQDAPLAGLQRELASFGSGGLDVASGYEPFLLYDNDVWRYLWDGAVLSSGASPWAASPAQIDGSAELADASPETESWQETFEDTVLERDRYTDVISRLSFPTVHTVYGPVAQALFALSYRLAPGSVLAWKLLVLLAEAALLLLIVPLWRRLDPSQRPSLNWILLAWSWNPLVLKELAGSAHLDVFLTLLVLWSVQLAVQRSSLAIVPLAFAVGVKPTALALAPLLLPFVPKRAWLWGALAGGAVWLPFYSSLPSYLTATRVLAREWQFNAGWWTLVRRIAPGESSSPGAVDAANLVYASALAGLAALALFKLRSEPSTRDLLWWSGVLLTFVVWLGPVVNPWYLLWALPFFVLCGASTWPWLSLCAVVALSYLHYIDGSTPALVIWLQHLSFVAVAGGVCWRLRNERSRVFSRRTMPGPS